MACSASSWRVRRAPSRGQREPGAGALADVALPSNAGALLNKCSPGPPLTRTTEPGHRISGPRPRAPRRRGGPSPRPACRPSWYFNFPQRSIRPSGAVTPPGHGPSWNRPCGALAVVDDGGEQLTANNARFCGGRDRRRSGDLALFRWPQGVQVMTSCAVRLAKVLVRGLGPNEATPGDTERQAAPAGSLAGSSRDGPFPEAGHAAWCGVVYVV
jgi:hypothetical protein